MNFNFAGEDKYDEGSPIVLDRRTFERSPRISRIEQDAVADMARLSRSAISQIESGQRGLDAIELKRFADIYQRPVSYFIGETTPASLQRRLST